MNSSSTLGLKMQPLTLLDRCDRCGARAFVKAAMLNGDLLFCAHHWHTSEEVISRISIGIVDELDKLDALEANMHKPLGER